MERQLLLINILNRKWKQRKVHDYNYILRTRVTIHSY